MSVMEETETESGWVEMWSSSDSEDESGYSDDSLSLCPKMEAVHAGGECIVLPEEMCDKSNIFRDILSMDTWKSFSEEQRQHLKNFLPDFPENDCSEKDRCVEMLFSGETMRFNNPLTEFQSNLKSGYYRPDIARMRTLLRKTRYKDYKRREKWRMFKLVKSVLVSRARLADAVVNGEKPQQTGSGASQQAAGANAADRRTKNHEARVRARYLQELQLIREKLGDSDNSSDDNDSIPVYSQILKRNRRKEFQTGGSCILGTLSPGPNPWDISKYPCANPYQPNQLTYTQLLKTHYNRKNHKKFHPGLYTEDITMEEVAQRCKLLKRPPLNSKTLLNKKPKVKAEEVESVDEWNGLYSMSGPGSSLQASPLQASPLMDSTTLISQEPDEDSERVDIEAVDDLTDAKPSISLFNSLLGSSKASSRASSTSSIVNRKIKSESPVDTSSKKLSLESLLDEPVTHSLGTLPSSHVQLTPSHASLPLNHVTLSSNHSTISSSHSTIPSSLGTAPPAKRPRAESTDSHFRSLSQPSGRQIKEIPPLPKKPEHKRSQSLTEGKTASSSSRTLAAKSTIAESKSSKLMESTVKSTKSSDDLRSTGKLTEDLMSLPNFKKIKTEPTEELTPLPSFKKLKSELPDKNTQPLPSFKKLKSGEIVDDLLSLPTFKKLKPGEAAEDLLPLPSFKKLKSGDSVEDLLPLPSFKKLKSETAEYHARVKLAKEGGTPTSTSVNIPQSPASMNIPPTAHSLQTSVHPHSQPPSLARSTTPVPSGGLSVPSQTLALGMPASTSASGVAPPPLKVEPLEPPPQALPSFNVVQNSIKSSSTRIMTPATLSDLDGIDMMALPVDFDTETSLDDLKGKIELKEETQACFFSLIRDVVTSTEDHRMDLVELEARLKTWASSPIAPLNHWYTPDIEKQLLSALFFLTGESQDIVPEDYVPYMEYKVSCNAYQWIGAGRDSDHRLVPLCNLWSERAHATPTQPRPALLIHRPIGFRVDGAGVKEVVLARPGRSNENSSGEVTHTRGPAVQPSSLRDKQIFRIQEKQRYESPQRSFTYRVGNSEAVLGPVRTTNNLPASKARGHTLLAPTRPKSVTILELVRDAVARLPGGQGTRADIVTLLKDSQYLLDEPVESVLSSVVSGALDKLHSEEDPSVKYDTKRKIWVYQHSQRSPQEFERLHALGLENKPQKPKPSRKAAKKKETQPKETDTNNQTAAVNQLGDQKLEGSSGSSVKTGAAKAIIGGSGDTSQDRMTNQANKKTSSASSQEPVSQARMADVATATVNNASAVKKVGSGSPVGGSGVDKQTTKSIVKVITGAQASSPNQVRNLPKQTISAQQMLQLKQQLIAEGKKVMSQSGNQQGLQPQQQVIVMKGGDQQQMIVISGGGNQPQFVVEQGVLSAKQHKQIQQMLSKQQEQQQDNPTPAQHRQTSAIALQQQLQQLILAKQQQMLAEQNKVAGQQVGSQGKVGSGGQQMILVKQGSTESDSSGPSQGKVGSSSQQMILVKGSSEGDSGQGKVGTSSQQMILVKGSGDGEGVGGVQGKVGSGGQQMILVKGSSEGDSVGSGQTLQQMILVSKGGSSQSGGSSSPGSSADLILVKQQGQSGSAEQLAQGGTNVATTTSQQILLKQQQATSSQGQQTDLQQISQQQLQQILLKQQQQQQNQSEVSSQLQQLLIKQLEGPAQQLQHLLVKQPGGQGESVQQISQQQLQHLLVKQQSGNQSESVQQQLQHLLVKQSGSQGESVQQQLQHLLVKQQGSQGESVQQISQQQLQQLLLKQQHQNSAAGTSQVNFKKGEVQQIVIKQSGQSSGGGQSEVTTTQHQQGVSQQQLQQLLAKQSQSQQGETQSQLQQLVMKQGSGCGDTQQVQLLVKQSQSQQGETQSQLQQLVMKQGSGSGETQQVQLLVKQSQSQQGDSQSQLQQLVVKQGSGSGETQQVQLLVKQQGGQTDVQHISQQQLQQILMKQQQQQQMIIVKQHDQKHIQVIPQNKTQSLTLAQIQQLQQQQQQLQQKNTVTTSLLTSPRVVTSLGGTGGAKGQTSQMVAKVQGSVVSVETLLAAQHKQGIQGGTVNRTSLGQYAVVSVPQQRVSVSSSGETVMKQTMAGSSSSSSSSTSSSPRLPISVAQLTGKQLLLTGKPTTQNVLLGTTSSGQAVLLHQGSQQILIPSQTLKALHGLKVIPITGTSVPSPHRTNAQGLRGQGQQVFARLVAPSTRPVQVVQQSQAQQQNDPQPPNQQQPND